MSDNTGMKTCGKCKTSKPRSAFYGHESTADKLQTSCKECQRKYIREHYTSTLTNEVRKAIRKGQKSYPIPVSDTI